MKAKYLSIRLLLLFVLSILVSSCIVEVDRLPDDDDKDKKDQKGKDSDEEEEKKGDSDKKEGNGDSKKDNDGYYSVEINSSIVYPQGVARIDGGAFKLKVDSCYSDSDIHELRLFIGESANVLDMADVAECKFKYRHVEGTVSQFYLSGLSQPTYYVCLKFHSSYGDYQSGVVRLDVPFWKEVAYEKPLRAVDLGLSVKWASSNLGASDMFDEGVFYSWGECGEQKSVFNESDYYLGSFLDILPQDVGGSRRTDIVAASLGNGWRLPTMEEAKELRTVTNCKWSIGRGSKGEEFMVVKSKITNDSIVLPFCGHIEGDKRVYDPRQKRSITGCYLLGNGTKYLFFNRNDEGFVSYAVSGDGYRWWGYSVRPVKE